MTPAIDFGGPFHGLALLAPELVLTLTVLVLLGLRVAACNRRSVFTATALAGLAGAALSTGLAPVHGALSTAPGGLLVLDPLTRFGGIFFLAVAGITVWLAHAGEEIDDPGYGECCALVLSATVGMMLLAAATDILMIYLAFETMGILAYLLVGIKVGDPRSGEAALKYVLYGAFTSGILLFGLSLLFGLGATTDLAMLAGRMAEAGGNPRNRLLLILVMIFILAGLLFKTASFPFHFWCPDVYEGAPTAITAFLSVGPKAAGFILFIRLFLPLFGPAMNPPGDIAASGPNGPLLLAVISALTMTVGNVAALRQDNLKRLLAYSSIAHAGYLLMGIAAGGSLGLRSVLFYLPVYLFMNMGAFAVVAIVAGAGGGETIRDYNGLGGRVPVVALTMALFLFSLIGLPPFAGFVGKVYLFAAVIDRKIYWLAVVAAINTVISLAYYLRVVKAMYLEPGRDSSRLRVTLNQHGLLVVLAIPTLGLGLYWQPLALVVAAIF